MGNKSEMIKEKKSHETESKEESTILKMCEVLGKVLKQKQDWICCHIHKFLCSKEQAFSDFADFVLFCDFRYCCNL